MTRGSDLPCCITQLLGNRLKALVTTPVGLLREPEWAPSRWGEVKTLPPGARHSLSSNRTIAITHVRLGPSQAKPDGKGRYTLPLVALPTG